MWFTFLLVVHVLIAVTMTGIILMQQSEGGGLAGGGSPGGLMSARGAGNFLTRATAILAVLFVGISIVLATIAALDRAPTKIDANLQNNAAATASVASNIVASNALNATSGSSSVPLDGVAGPAKVETPPDAAGKSNEPKPGNTAPKAAEKVEAKVEKPTPKQAPPLPPALPKVEAPAKVERPPVNVPTGLVPETPAQPK